MATYQIRDGGDLLGPQIWARDSSIWKGEVLELILTRRMPEGVPVSSILIFVGEVPRQAPER